MEVFLGISAAGGTGIGPAFRIPDPVKRVLSQKKISSFKVDESWKRFENAIAFVTADVSEKLAPEANSFLTLATLPSAAFLS